MKNTTSHTAQAHQYTDVRAELETQAFNDMLDADEDDLPHENTRRLPAPDPAYPQVFAYNDDTSDLMSEWRVSSENRVDDADTATALGLAQALSTAASQAMTLNGRTVSLNERKDPMASNIKITTRGHDQSFDAECPTLSWCDGHSIEDIAFNDRDDLLHVGREIYFTMPVGSGSERSSYGRRPDIWLLRTQTGDEESRLQVTADVAQYTADELPVFVDALRQVAMYLEVNGAHLLAAESAPIEETHPTHTDYGEDG